MLKTAVVSKICCRDVKRRTRDSESVYGAHICMESMQGGALDEDIHLVHFYVATGTVCKSSTHDDTLKIEVILFLLQS